MNYGYMSGLGALGTDGGGPSREEVMALQNAIRAQPGCDVGSTGVDGIFGPRTKRGLTCMISAQGAGAVSSQFPFVGFLQSHSGTYYPPGTSSSRGGGGGGSQQPPTRTPQQAGAGGEIPWWGWALIAVGGATFLGFVGLMLSGDGDDRRPRDRRDRGLDRGHDDRGLGRGYDDRGYDDRGYDDRDRYYRGRRGRYN